MTQTQQILTTGQVAKLCNVAPRTVSKWFDTGQLRGYRIPGSKDRRIPLDHLVRFMKAHGMPLNGLDGSQLRVLVADADEALAELLKQALDEHERHEVTVAHSAFAAGVLIEQLKPHVLLIDLGVMSGAPRQFCRFIRMSDGLRDIRLIAMSANLTDGESLGLVQDGFDRVLRKPFHISEVLSAIDAAAG